MKVLIAYATAHGSTRSIAENVDRLLSARHQVTTRPMSEVGSLAGYDAVVLGSAVHDGEWLPEARAFLLGYSSDLSTRRVWLFSVGMADALPRPMRHMATRTEAKQLAQSVPADIRPRGTRLFSGVIRREHLPSRSARVRMHLIGARYGDFRDWPEIEAWAKEIALALEPTPRDSQPRTDR